MKIKDVTRGGKNRIKKPGQLFLAVLFVLTTAGTAASPVITLATAPDYQNIQGIITGSGVNLRLAPAFDGMVVAVLDRGRMVTVIGSNGSWYQVRLADGREGWVFKNYLSTEPKQPGSAESSAARSLELVSLAQTFIGTPYVYGGGSPAGFDCSGFVQYVFGRFGYKLSHSALAQAGTGVAVERENLLPGDMVFFITEGAANINHVGIYLGDDRFIHASSYYKQVRIASFSGYCRSCYQGARRVIAGP